MEKVIKNTDYSLFRSEVIMTPEYDERGYRNFCGIEMVKKLVYPFQKFCVDLRKKLNWKEIELNTQYKGEVFNSLNTIYVEPGLYGSINWETNFEYQSKKIHIDYLARYDYKQNREVLIIFKIDNIEILRIYEVLTLQYYKEKINELRILVNFLEILSDGLWEAYYGKETQISNCLSFKQKFEALKSVEETNISDDYKKEIFNNIFS